MLTKLTKCYAKQNLSTSIRAFSTKKDSQYWIDLNEKYLAKYYVPIPVVVERAEGIYMWDVEGKKYYDMMAGFAVCS